MGNPEEAGGSQPQEHHDPPPPYIDDHEAAAPPLPPRTEGNSKKNTNPFLDTTNATTSSSSSPRGHSPSASTARAKQQLPTPVRPAAKFPHTLGMYYQKAVRIPTFNLGESEDQPLLAVTFHPSLTLSGNPYLMLHSTADPGSPPLAIAEKAGRLGQRAEITMPGLAAPTSGATTSTPATETAAVATATSTEIMSAHISLTSVSYSFTLDPGSGHREKFEWRSSKGPEVKALAGLGGDGESVKHPVGRKLVRLQAEADGVGGTRASRDPGATSDGREVVAVWADNPKWSGNRAGGFQFLGSALTGELNERFSVMALATAVRIWEMLNEDSLRSAATSSLGAGNST